MRAVVDIRLDFEGLLKNLKEKIIRQLSFEMPTYQYFLSVAFAQNLVISYLLKIYKV